MDILTDKIISKTWRAALDLQSTRTLGAAKDIANEAGDLAELAESLQGYDD